MPSFIARDAIGRVLRVVVLTCLSWAAFGKVAHAETREAPVGGAPIALGGSNVACERPAGGWTVEDGGKSVRPPSAASAAGTVITLRVAASLADCARSPATLRLAATGSWPAAGPSKYILAVDDGWLSATGRGLSGVSVSWTAEQGVASSTCRDPTRVSDATSEERCTWTVPKWLAADPRSAPLRWWPAGAVVAADAVLFDARGKRAAPEAFAVTPSRVEVTTLLATTSVDVSSGVGRVALVHPELIQGADCHATTRCTINGNFLEVVAPPASASSVDVQLKLVTYAFDTRTSPPEQQPVIRLSVLRCPMEVASGVPLRDVDGARLVLRLEGACARDVASLAFLVDGKRAEPAQVVRAHDAAYVVLETDEIHAKKTTLVAVRGHGDGAVVALVQTDTRAPPLVHSVVEIPGFPPMDFIPQNRRATVHVPPIEEGQLVLLSVPGVYDARVENGQTTVQGAISAVGAVTLRFGLRSSKLPPPLDELDLAVLNDVLQRNVKEVDIPVPLGPIAEVVCTDPDRVVHRATPGVPLRLSFSARNGCRVILHRERLTPAYGTQKIQLEIEVEKFDLTPRSDAHVTKTLVVRPGREPLVAWIKGIAAPFDRAIIRISHVADEAHYLGALEIVGEPAEQWIVVFAGGHVRVYATTVIPTGLYRHSFASSGASGALTVSLGVLSRMTWLDSSGREGLLGVEAGVLALGLTGDVSPTTGASLFQIGAVAGLGLGLPIANAGQAAQASINLHVWFEQLISGSGGKQALGEQAIIFGPSISLGNVGTSF